jgi:hypothetical protein
VDEEMCRSRFRIVVVKEMLCLYNEDGIHECRNVSDTGG